MWKFCLKSFLFLLGIAVAQGNARRAVSELSVGGTAKLSVAIGAVEQILLVPGTSRAIELEIKQDSGDLRLRVFGPDKRQIRAAGPSAAQSTLFSFPVDGPGAYVLELGATNSNTASAELDASVHAYTVDRSGLESRIRAEDLFLRASELRSSANPGSIQESIRLEMEAEEIWRSVRDVRGQFLALAAEAESRLAISQFEDALNAYAKAERISGHDSSEMASLFNSESRVYLEWWKSTRASDMAERALKLSQAHNDVAGEAEALASRGEALYLVTEDDAARRDLNAAFTLIQNASHGLLAARIFRCLGWVEEDQGHLSRAAALIEKADQMFREAGDVRDSLNSLSDIATISGMQGDSYAAMLRHSSLSKLLQESGDHAGTAFSLDNLGTDYAELNRDNDALGYYLLAQRTFAGIHHDSGLLTSLGHLCATELRLGRQTVALRYCSESRALSQQVGDPKREAIAEWRMAKAYQSLGRMQTALLGYKKAASMSEEVHDSRFQSLSLIDMGIVLEKLGSWSAAYEAYEKASSLSQGSEDLSGELEARFHLAEVESAQGRTLQAKQTLDATLRLIEARRSSVADDYLRSSYFASAKKSYDLYIELLMHQRLRSPSESLDGAALEISESSHARSLLDAVMASGQHSVNDQNQVSPADLLRIHGEIERLYDERLKLILATRRSSALRDNAMALTRALDEYDRLADTLDSKDAQRGNGRPLSSQALLEKSKSSAQTYFEYALGDRESYLWVIDHGELESHVLPSKQKIMDEVKSWKSLVSSRALGSGESFSAYLARVGRSDRELPKAASSLSCMLLGPFLKTRMKDVVIVPDGILQSLSFGSLPLNGCEGKDGPPVIAAHSVTYTPSLSIFFAQKGGLPDKQFHGEVALIADPVFDSSDSRVKTSQAGSTSNAARTRASANVEPGAVLPRLAGTRAEALSIAGLFHPEQVQLALDFNASIETLLSGELSSYRVWHLATHGIVDPSSSDSSGLILSLVDAQGKPVYGYLHSRDIAELKLDANLVVLSSCGSGEGTVVSGEGMTGVSYAFLHAGVKRVVSTLWSVDDEASRTLMTAFYKHMTVDHQEPEEALKEAQLQLLDQARFSHPYYWAGYIVSASTQ